MPSTAFRSLAWPSGVSASGGLSLASRLACAKRSLSCAINSSISFWQLGQYPVEWVIIDLEMLSNEEILETYCRNTDWEVDKIVEVSDDVATFPTSMLLVVA